MQIDRYLNNSRRAWTQLRRAIALVWHSNPRLMLISTALVVVQSIFPVLTLYLMKLVIDVLVNGLATPVFDGSKVFAQVLPFIVATGLVTLFAAGVRTLASLVNEAQIQIVTAYIYEKIHAKSIELDMAYYENSEYHDTLHRAQQQASFRPARIVNDLTRIAQSGLSLLSIVGLLVSFNWVLTVLLFCAAVPGFVLRIRFSALQYEWQRRKTLDERRIAYYNQLITTPFVAKEIRLFNLGGLFKERYHSIRDRLDREQRGISARQAGADLVIQASATTAVIGSYAFLAYQTAQHVITLGALVMYYQAFQRGQGFYKILSPVPLTFTKTIYLSPACLNFWTSIRKLQALNHRDLCLTRSSTA